MSENSLKTLLHPFESGLVEPVGDGARTLLINAPSGFRGNDAFGGELVATQDFRPDFLALRGARLMVTPQPEGQGFDLVLVHCGRHRGQNELWVADALRRTRPGGRIVVAGAKTDGAASLAKRLASLVDVEGQASKSHGVTFWFTRRDDEADAIAVLEAANPQIELPGGFVTRPGMFSNDHVDPGSRLLAEALPSDLKGAVADFGAGWGYLSVELAKRAAKVVSIDLYEAGHGASEVAKANIASLAPGIEARVFWHDLLSEPVDRRYDAVVMNPPFHQGRAAEPTIGERMIGAARSALKSGGRLYLVANRTLAYETRLRADFARQGEVCRDERYKVLWAIR